MEPNKATVLVVDDEPNILSSLRRALRKENCRVRTASSGDQALKMLAEEPVSVIITDQRMPRMSGTELLARAKREYPEAIRILITGYRDLSTAEDAINRGEVYRFLTKPWNENDLALTVQGAIERHHLLQENRRLQELTEEKNRELQELNFALEEKVARRTEKLIETLGQWNSTFQAIPDPIIYTDGNLNVLRVNRAFVKLVGHTPAPGETLKCCELCYGRAKAPLPDCPLVAARNDKRPIYTEVSQPCILGDRERNSHEQYHFSIWCYPVLDAQKEVVALVQVIRDTTEESRLLQQLFQSERMAAIGFLAGGIAHEINNPIAGILALTQLLLKETPPDNPNRADLKRIESLTFRCERFIQDLLGFARESRGEERRLISLNEIITNSLVFLNLQTKQFEVKIETELSHIPHTVFGNFRQLQQVLINLLINAFQSMPNGGAVRLHTCLSPSGEAVEVRISDTGPGIATEDLSRIFDPFFTTKIEGKGTGLGLTISRRIVEEHGGSIEVESVAGRGTTFVVTLPTASAPGPSTPMTSS